MTRKSLALVAALVAAGTTITSAAEAGGGVRLGFGFPMGSFVATPARGGGGYAAKPSAAQKLAAKKAAQKQAARRAASNSKLAKATEKSGKDETASEETSPSVRTSGSTALIETTTTNETSSTAVAAIPPSDPAPAETKIQDIKTDSTPTKTSNSEDGECRKFIPALSLTVSVACED